MGAGIFSPAPIAHRPSTISCYIYRVSTSHLSTRVPDELKKKVASLAARLGYRDTSKFLNAALEALVEKYDGEEWRSGLVHFSGDVVTDEPGRSVEPSDTYAFPVIAPARFWRYLRRKRDADDDE